ncbi:hypothetical protein TSOC111612_01380 [Tsukamurella ocularis]|uniref:hypothetical protein n=1 Tax=Tsukamurella ocularis TaxID=1970234 RepID=UPI0039EEEEDC
MARVKTPVKGFSGTVAGVTFDDGVGETKDARALAYFERHGYEVDTKADDDAKAKAEAEKAKAEAERLAAEEAEKAKAEADAKASTPKPAAKPAATKSSAPAAE